MTLVPDKYNIPNKTTDIHRKVLTPIAIFVMQLAQVNTRIIMKQFEEIALDFVCHLKGYKL